MQTFGWACIHLSWVYVYLERKLLNHGTIVHSLSSTAFLLQCMGVGLPVFIPPVFQQEAETIAVIFKFKLCIWL